VKLLIS